MLRFLGGYEYARTSTQEEIYQAGGGSGDLGRPASRLLPRILLAQPDIVEVFLVHRSQPGRIAP